MISIEKGRFDPSFPLAFTIAGNFWKAHRSNLSARLTMGCALRVPVARTPSN
ncbi:hypothetical protein [Corynebacterium kozikiae]|uniref:hypothetical protein n=1 Tax=Corynebacterium kozikiae TaxID=2968469 RepID=UPI00359C8B09